MRSLPEIKKIGITTGGGDAPGLNAVICAVVLAALTAGAATTKGARFIPLYLVLVAVGAYLRSGQAAWAVAVGGLSAGAALFSLDTGAVALRSGCVGAVGWGWTQTGDGDGAGWRRVAGGRGPWTFAVGLTADSAYVFVSSCHHQDIPRPKSFIRIGTQCDFIAAL